MNMRDFHSAIRIIQNGGVSAFTEAERLVGRDVAFGILVFHLRKEYAKKEGWNNPDIAAMVNGHLSEHLPEVYADFS
jgi:hypothetical protein